MLKTGNDSVETDHRAFSVFLSDVGLREFGLDLAPKLRGHHEVISLYVVARWLAEGWPKRSWVSVSGKTPCLVKLLFLKGELCRPVAMACKGCPGLVKSLIGPRILALLLPRGLPPLGLLRPSGGDCRPAGWNKL